MTSIAFRSALAGMMLLGLAARAQAACSDGPEVLAGTVDHVFPSSSRWNFQIFRRPCEGLVLGSAFYLPRGATSFFKVLDRGMIAEIHVPFATGTPRNFEVTSTNEGLGDTNTAGNSFAVPLTTSECPSPGVLLDGNRICMNEFAEHGLRSRSGDELRMAGLIEVFMSSQVGKENYISRWEFHDDGHIEVALGVSGTIPVIKNSTNTNYPKYGARLDPTTGATPRIGLAHHHNVYYRLDLDIGGAGDDQVIQRVFKPNPSDCSGSSSGTCGEYTKTTLTTETAKSWSATENTTWTILDKVITNAEGRNIGYELIPHQSGIWRGMTSSSEPWAGNEVFVTAFNSCERFAAKNTTPHLPASCTGAAGHVSAMISDKQNIDGADIVVWYAQRMLHQHRDEDEANMPIEWMSFELSPRNLWHHNPQEAQ
jgi:primary-amine oxidase